MAKPVATLHHASRTGRGESVAAIERRSGLSYREFEREYLRPRRPVIITDALEPCAARSSGGPSCAERLIGAGVARVVVALEGDPSPMAAGAGLRRLQAAGVATELVVRASTAPPAGA